ncbi:MAG: hypothetical protein AAGB00_10245 [Planctomycetota bacterium]
MRSDQPRHRPEDHDSILAPSLPSFGTVARFAATLIGLTLMIAGACYVISLATMLLKAITDPTGVAGLVDTWQQAVGQESLQVNTEQVTFNGSRVLAIAVLGGLVVAAGWLLLSLITTGAKVVTTVSAERKSLPKDARRGG